MNANVLEKLELNKILLLASGYAVLENGKECLKQTLPESELADANASLAMTEEATKLLFQYGVGKIEYFPPFGDELRRAAKRATLTCGELISVKNLLRSVRVLAKSVDGVNDPTIVLVRNKLRYLYFDQRLEDDIERKIINDGEVSDFASDRLYTIRREIRLLNERIRAKLAEYLSGEQAKYLQEGIVTMRGDRYVLPVKAEYKRSVRGFVHDRSQSGATVFIEPEYILELNNELVTLAIDEKEEIERILAELSARVGMIAGQLEQDIAVMGETDALFAKAEYSYHIQGIRPHLNAKGIVSVRRGRHPLIEPKTVVPVSVSLGENYDFLLVSGPNTGGKTVTLKMVGLFCLMAACGFFVPAGEDTRLSVFHEIFCDIGDAQSIEQSLSTFSSHVTNIISIVETVDEKSLVLIDELGGGTDPEEGQALAKAVISYLMKKGCKGIVTTHYTALKEYAFKEQGVENASMAFDADSLRPLYQIKIGLPGSSNALSISKRLGLPDEILEDAYRNLSDDAKSLTNILRSAEDSRLEAQASLDRTRSMEKEWAEKIALLDEEREKLRKEKERLFLTAKAESRRIVNEKVAEAEELVGEIEKIFAQEEITQADLIKARTLKNKVVSTSFQKEEQENLPQYIPFVGASAGDTVYVRTVGGEGKVLTVNEQKKEAQVQCGSMRLRVTFAELMNVVKTAQPPKQKPKKKENVTVVRKIGQPTGSLLELNVIGMTVMEAIPEIELFLDRAILQNIAEVKIVHGMGTGRLKAGVHDFLRKDKRVAEYRLGIYGEGEAGVTIVKLK
ncbi:MAG: endonuclease MutS2 [Clostridia bacterium]|nr:endonuclease MutS2 [Clostridia bacterium]